MVFQNLKTILFLARGLAKALKMLFSILPTLFNVRNFSSYNVPGVIEKEPMDFNKELKSFLPYSIDT